MEPMECDIGEQIVRCTQKMKSLPKYTNYSQDNLSDFSDMDVDSSSPSRGLSSAQSSMSFEHISRAMVSVLSLINVNDGGGDKSVVSLPSTSSQKSHRLSSTEREFNEKLDHATSNACDAVGLTKRKSGYGIPEGDTNFSHFPDSTKGGSLRKRQSRDSSESKMKHKSIDSSDVHYMFYQRKTQSRDSSESKMKHKSIDSSDVHHQNQVSSDSQDGIKLSVTSEIQSNRWSSCISYILIFLLAIAAAVCVCCSVFLYSVYVNEKCKLSRDFNKKVLELELETNVFGQHLAARIVPEKIEEYFSKLRTSSVSGQLTTSSDLCKPLVLSFDGWTGVGKNFICRFISETFKHSKIMNYIIPLNFPHKSFKDVYHLQIKEWILGNFTQCVVNIIVIDEMDKAFHGVTEGLIEAINLLTQPCSSSSPTIFLLLSNSHANDINKVVLKFLLDSPTNKREQLTQEHFSSIFTSELDVWSSAFVNEHLIDAFLPFLPLEREHVIQCIKRDLVSKRFSTNTDTVNRVLQELSFSSFGDIHLSQTGCKRVADKVDLVMFGKHH